MRSRRAPTDPVRHVAPPPSRQAECALARHLDRRALALRHELQTGEQLEWIETGRDDVLRFRRPNGWEVVTNFGATPFALGHAAVLLSSAPLNGGMLPGETTVWLSRP